jgi:hypothetical protein
MKTMHVLSIPALLLLLLARDASAQPALTPEQSNAKQGSEAPPKPEAAPKVDDAIKTLTQADLEALTNKINSIIAPFTLAKLRSGETQKQALKSLNPQWSDAQLSEAAGSPAVSTTTSETRLEGTKEVMVLAKFDGDQNGRYVEISISNSGAAGVIINDYGTKVAKFNKPIKAPLDPIGYSEVWLKQDGLSVEYSRTNDGKWIKSGEK